MDQIQVSPLARLILQQYTRIYQQFDYKFQTQTKLNNQCHQNQLQLIDKIIQDYQRNIDVTSPENNLSLIQRYEKKEGNTEQFRLLKCRLQKQIQGKRENQLLVPKGSKFIDQNQQSESDSQLVSPKHTRTGQRQQIQINSNRYRQQVTKTKEIQQKQVSNHKNDQVRVEKRESENFQEETQKDNIQKTQLANEASGQQNLSQVQQL